MSLSFSLIIPVFREAAIINRTIENIRKIKKSADFEIIVVDGDPDGNTIREIKDKDVNGLLSVKGRGNQLNAGAARAKGNILIFLHVDTRLPSNALEHIANAFKDNTCIGGAFDLGIDSGRKAMRIIEKMASWRSRLTRIPYGDQAIFIRADYYKTLGGFSNIPILEDVDLMRRIKQNKGKIKILHERVLTSSRRWDTEGIIFCTLRNWLLILLFLMGVKPATLKRFYK
ncbi:MAG: TIGR04283 family arsenosugar biosynthesis glycosyltransferase [Smithella sp.]